MRSEKASAKACRRTFRKECMSTEDSQMLAIPLETVPLDQPIDYPIYLKFTDSWVLFRPKDDILSKERCEALRERGVNLVYVPDLSWAGYVRNLEKAAGFNDDKDASSTEQVVQIRALLFAYSQEVERNNRLQKSHFQRFVRLSHSLTSVIYGGQDSGARLLRRYGDSGLYFVNHSLNVAIYCGEMGKKLGISLSSAKKMICGALVHNMGYLFLPKSVIYKPGSLTEAEWDLIYSHPTKGAELLDGLDASREVILMALQHHERFDGKGYPAKRTNRDIHLFARICSIADVFDALTNNAPYQKPLGSGEAVQKMLTMKGKFDPDILSTMSQVG